MGVLILEIDLEGLTPIYFLYLWGVLDPTFTISRRFSIFWWKLWILLIFDSISMCLALFFLYYYWLTLWDLSSKRFSYTLYKLAFFYPNFYLKIASSVVIWEVVCFVLSLKEMFMGWFAVFLSIVFRYSGRSCFCLGQLKGSS